MNQLHKRSYLFYFIALQMTDIMPPDIRWKYAVAFINQFLNIILSEISLPEIDKACISSTGFVLETATRVTVFHQFFYDLYNFQYLQALIFSCKKKFKQRSLIKNCKLIAIG